MAGLNHEPVVRRKSLLGNEVLKADIPSKVDFADCHPSRRISEKMCGNKCCCFSIAYVVLLITILAAFS
jgi:hypothetical protein